MENSQFTPEQLEAIKQRLRQIQAQAGQSMQNMPASPDARPPMANMPGQLNAARQYQNAAEIIEAKANEELPPEDKAAILRRLQKQNFIGPEDSLQENSEPAPSPAPKWSDEATNVLRKKKQDEEAEKLFKEGQ